MKDSPLFKNWGTFKKGMNSAGIQLSFASHLQYSLSKDQFTATNRDLYHSLALTARDRLIERWILTQQLYHQHDVKRIYYLSAEYLMGRILVQNLVNLGIYQETRQAMKELKIDLNELAELEADMGLGNGGLGRLAACFLDSMAALELPSHGYGIRYEFGIFDQEIHNCAQRESPENWLKYGNPWEITRPELSFPVNYFGKVIQREAPDGSARIEWCDTSKVIGVAHDIPIAGYGNNTVNTLRLWSAKASNEFELKYFQHGDYLKAVEEKNISENISKVLYPNDQIFVGKELRLKQQYFFVSCSLQDIIRRYLIDHQNFEAFPDKVVIQMNDTHPSLAVVELMRILLDVYHLSWENAWKIVTKTCAFTNHTLLAEALETWPVHMLEKVLPRHLQIIYEINRRFLRDVSTLYLGDAGIMARMSLISDENEKKVRMAHLAIVGSFSVNGVAELHSRILREKALKEFHQMFPERFNNKTNGVTPRLWLLIANPRLAELITHHIGDRWIKELEELHRLEPLADDSAFQEEWRRIKHKNKEKMAKLAHKLTGVTIDPQTIFDFQVKRIHEYKRQTLNILHVIYCWLKLKKSPDFSMHPRTFLFGGKAAPGYYMAKLIIRLICMVAETINRDVSTNHLLKIIFLPNYRVSLAQRIFPAADVSEQISTAGFEASGTSNMKFALNGALTIGSLDGANIEIMRDVGPENIFIFGLNVDQVAELKASYSPYAIYENDPFIKESIDLIRNGFFSPDEPHLFQPLVDSLLRHDEYMVLADFHAYHQCQMEIDKLYRSPADWMRKAILNLARMGAFSSDRTIAEYNRDIWRCQPLSVIGKGDSGGATCQ